MLTGLSAVPGAIPVCAMAIRAELAGQRFGLLVVVAYAYTSQDGCAYWFCECDCGKSSVVAARALRSGNTKTCGCSRRRPGQIRPSVRVDLTGQRFGRLEVLGAARKDVASGAAYWLCRCDCGSDVVTRTDYLRTGRSISCGCWRSNPRPGSAYRARVARLKWFAARDGVAYNLTDSEASAIFELPCHYCGAPPSTVIHQAASKGRGGKFHRTFVSGFDKVVPELGYTAGNVVPCCKWCNFAKNNRSVEAFQSWLLRAHAHLVSTGWE